MVLLGGGAHLTRFDGGDGRVLQDCPWSMEQESVKPFANLHLSSRPQLCAFALPITDIERWPCTLIIGR